jgi:polar amino acid transport system substrate-binding protein
METSHISVSINQVPLQATFRLNWRGRLYRKRFVIVTLLSVFNFSSPSVLASEVVPICVGEFAPYNHPTLPRSGPMIDIATEAFRRSGYQIQVKFAPWARNILLGENAKCGILGIWRDSSRDLKFDFSQAILKQELGFFGTRGVTLDLNRHATLKSLNIGVQLDSYLSPSLNDKTLHFDLANSILINLSKLAKRHIDVAYGEKASGQYLIENNPDLLANVEWKTTVEVKYNYLGFVKTYRQKDELLEAFNAGLNSMKTDGSLQKIVAAARLESAR